MGQRLVDLVDPSDTCGCRVRDVRVGSVQSPAVDSRLLFVLVAENAVAPRSLELRLAENVR